MLKVVAWRSPQWSPPQLVASLRHSDAPGGGDSFHGCIVVYTKLAKTAMLGVPSETLDVYSAVSQPVAEQMAQGLLERSPA